MRFLIFTRYNIGSTRWIFVCWIWRKKEEFYITHTVCFYRFPHDLNISKEFVVILFTGALLLNRNLCHAISSESYETNGNLIRNIWIDDVAVRFQTPTNNVTRTVLNILISNIKLQINYSKWFLKKKKRNDYTNQETAIYYSLREIV